MLRLSDGEEIMTLAFFVLIQYRSVTDRQTDMPPLAIPAVSIARYANALVKITYFHRQRVRTHLRTLFGYATGIRNDTRRQATT